jgi:hypothetical protein
MSDPVSWVYIASAAIGAVGAISSGQQQKTQFQAYAQANEYNALAQQQRAQTSRLVAGEREQMQRRESAFAIGKQRAAAAESGLGLGGSTGDLTSQSELFAEMDALNVRYQGELEASGLMSQANLEGWQAGVNRQSGSSAAALGYVGAAGQILSSYGGYLASSGRVPSRRPTVMGLYGNYSSNNG